MSYATLDEVSVLSAIYCGKGEMEVLEQSEEMGLVLCIRVSAADGTLVELVFTLPPSYPLCPPLLSVSSSLLSRGRCSSIKDKLLERAAQLTPNPMIHQLVQWLQESGEVCVQRGEEEAVAEEEEAAAAVLWTTLLVLDHMRSRTRYVRMIQRWTADLQLAGRLLLGRPILLLLQGPQDRIKEYLRLHKTEKVDVDSSGRKCKERMMKVLSESRSSSSVLRRSGFQVKEVQTREELQQSFEELDLGELYQRTVTHL